MTEKIEIGTKITCPFNGWGEIIKSEINSGKYPFGAIFENGVRIDLTPDLKHWRNHSFGCKIGHLKKFVRRFQPKTKKFKVGDAVTSTFGKGKIKYTNEKFNVRYPILVAFDNGENHSYTKDGRLKIQASISLFHGHHEEITIKTT